MTTDVCAGKITKGSHTLSPSTKSIRYALQIVVAVLLFSFSGTSEGATHLDLDKALNRLSASADKNSLQDIEVINAIRSARAPAQSLTVASVYASKGQVLDAPVYFKLGSPVASLQFDVVFSTSYAISSALPGIAAAAGSKNVQMNAIQGGYRIIVFGLNQTTLSSGPLVILKISVPANATVGKKPIRLNAITASSPAGLNVPMTGINSSLTVK